MCQRKSCLCKQSWILSCMLAAFLLPQGVASIGEFEGKLIADIQFSPGQPLDQSDLANALPLKKGAPLRKNDIARAIDSLFATGRFDDIVVEVEPAGDGVLVRFVTKNTWFVGGVSIEGKVSFPPNRGQLTRASQLSLGTVFQDDDLTKALTAMKRLFESNGLYEATVTSSIDRGENQQVFITFTVKQGTRAKYTNPVLQGNPNLPENTIFRATGWRIPLIHWWLRVSEARTRKGAQGVLRKYQGRDHLKAQVELKNLDYDAKRRRVQPTLNITPGPKVKVKAVEAKVSRRVLKRYVPVFDERRIDNDLLVEGKRNLSDYFQSRGYFDVDVEFRIQPPQNDLETIEYVISQGQRSRMVKVSIVGNKYFDTETIRERMFMQPAALNVRRGRYSEAFRRKDEETIANLYRSNGFRDVKVTSEVEKGYKGKTGQIGVTVKIEEGDQWLVEGLTIGGILQVDRNDVTSALASAEGQPFSEVNLAADRNSVLTYYYERGFPNADLNSSWEPSALPHHVNVIYTVSEGRREFVRDVITSGLRTTRQSLVDKKLSLHPGDPLSPIEQTEIQKRFYDLGVFERVDTAIENPDGDTEHKYILYNFTEANRYTVGVGVGAQVARFGTPSTTSLSSPAGSAGFSPNFSLDASRLNFLGIGHTATLRGMYSSIEKRGSFTYLAPRFQNVEGRNITFTALWEDSLNVNTFASKRAEASIQMSQRFSKSLTALFRYSYRRVSVSDVVIPVLLVPQLLAPVRIGIVSVNLAQDRRDNPADPHRGIFNTADIGLAAKGLGAERSFGRVLLRNATYYQLTKTVTLARQTQFGVIAPFAAPAGLSEQESVPLPERFFGGGADSLRAFPFNQAGPRDTGTPLVPNGPGSQATGFPLGGNALLFNNVELRFPLIGENIQGVIFHDMGNVFSKLSNITLRSSQRNLQDFDYTVHAVGFGVRYRTPIGPIRGDLAYSINPPSFIGFKGTPTDLLQCRPTSPCQGVQQSVGHFQFFFSIGQTF